MSQIVASTNKSRNLQKIKILVAIQTQGEQIEAVEVEADYFHNGSHYIVMGHEVPYAEHYNLGQAALDWLRVALIDSDFMRRHRRTPPRNPQIEPPKEQGIVIA